MQFQAQKCKNFGAAAISSVLFSLNTCVARNATSADNAAKMGKNSTDDIVVAGEEIEIFGQNIHLSSISLFFSYIYLYFACIFPV